MLNAMQEAFRKSGLVSEQELEASEKEKQKQAEEIKRQEKEKEQRQQTQRRRESAQYTAKLALFQKLWDGENSHKYMVHLLYSFTPIDSSHYAWDDSEFKGQKKCCICGISLISKQFMFEHIPEISRQSLDQLQRSLRGEVIYPRQEFVARFGNVVLGLITETSNSAFCSDCHTSFYEWIQNELIRENRTISKILHQRQLEVSLTTTELVRFNEIRGIHDHQILSEFIDSLHSDDAKTAVRLSLMR